MTPTALLDPAQDLNLHCTCQTLDSAALRTSLAFDPRLAALSADVQRTHPTLFAATSVYLKKSTVALIEQAVTAIENIASLAPYQAQALARADAIARLDHGPLSACMGYDFHIDAQGVPHLIEINTNAGGGLLNAVLIDAHRPCARACAPGASTGAHAQDRVQAQWDMFLSEWRLQRGDQPLRHAVIVDEAPDQQYLAPEFTAYAALFERHGVSTRIADPAELRWADGQLTLDGQAVDLVYNRLTDFYLQAPASAALRAAYSAAAVVLTPHPRAHALLADKRNLIALSSPDALAQWGVDETTRTLLAQVVPTTREVEPAQADAWWARRKDWFFKPVAGYGGRATYRGRSVTKGVWAHIAQGGYVGQTLIPPGERALALGDQTLMLRYDVRAYTYAGRVQQLAARLYQGQTTNFRTEGSGFAPVHLIDDAVVA